MKRISSSLHQHLDSPRHHIRVESSHCVRWVREAWDEIGEGRLEVGGISVLQ